MPQVLLGVGSNLGDRESILRTAVARLARELDVLAQSSWFSYPAIGGPDGQEDFLNGAVLAQTSLRPDGVRKLLQAVEQSAGRERVVRWSARTLDCDLLLYGSEMVNTTSLQVPHPRMITRRFVLEPANEIAPDMVHPLIGWTIGELHRHLITAPPYFCILSSDIAQARRIAKQTAEATGFLLAVPLEPCSGVEPTTALTWARRVASHVPNIGGDVGGVVGCNWYREPWLGDGGGIPSAVDWPVVEPKLIMVADAIDSPFGSRFLGLAPAMRLPMLFLTDDAEHALQDAIGAVMAMTMPDHSKQGSKQSIRSEDVDGN